MSAAIGDRLRAARQAMHLSLRDVEVKSDGEFKASSVGAYERGVREISAARLQRLAEFYGIGAESFVSDLAGRVDAAASSRRFTIDLTKLRTDTGPERDVLYRFVASMQASRQEFSGDAFSIRGEDVRAIACLFGGTPEAMRSRLESIGLLA